ncbi:pumilio homolog 12-like [Gastrolobium bilobum]|uniref:pumilio homolog 12-like n=1 Tax=Gastrolobium bilobum TaxID=150636 RepID=UPI002AB17476|nr:pumilio homolog 12-like [Gastrolobium bilobum]
MLKILVNVKTPEKIYAFVLALKRITLTLMKTANGGYVIQHCVKLFPPAYQKVILDEVAKNCINIATDKYGSPIIQKCLGHVDQGQAIFLLVKEIIVNAAVLAEDQYGEINKTQWVGGKWTNEVVMAPSATVSKLNNIVK